MDTEGRGKPDGGDRVGRVSPFFVSFPIVSMLWSLMPGIRSVKLEGGTQRIHRLTLDGDEALFS